MERFLVTYDNRIMLNLRSIASIHKVVIYSDDSLPKLGDNCITEAGIYVEIFANNEARYFPIASRSQIDLIAEVELDEEVQQAINVATQDADEYKWLLNMIMTELRSKLAGKKAVIDIWDVALGGLKSYHECLQEDEKREAGIESMVPLSHNKTWDLDDGKPFVFSEGILERFDLDKTLMNHIIKSQERFRNHDWGEVSHNQHVLNTKLKAGHGTVGRYPKGSDEPAVVISDEGSEYKVQYEDEREE